jgi:hypothetical protein
VAKDQKGACAKSAWLVFFDESGISLLPVTRRTWSPRGVTPILRHRCNWKRASMAAALGYHASDADRGPRLCFHVQKDSYNTQTLIGVLEQLAGFYAGHQVVLLWDGLGRTGATTCALGWTPSGTGFRWSGCRRMRPS